MPRPSNTSQRRKQILAGMERVLAEHGYEGATIARIARAAELAPGLVHHHFQSKREILASLLEELGARAEDRAERALTQAADQGGPAIDALIEAYLGAGRTTAEEGACWLAMAAESARDPALRAQYEALIRKTAQRFEALLTAQLPANARKDAHAIATALVAGIHGSLALAAAAPAAVARGATIVPLRRLVHGGSDRVG